ncbi:MAG: hypothetical protein RLZZ15_3616, partial [Verrucomicrobiota bacterium]
FLIAVGYSETSVKGSPRWRNDAILLPGPREP